MPWDRPEMETKLENERKNLDLWCRAAGVAATLGAFALDLLIKPLAMILLFAGAVGIISAIAGAPWGYLAWRVIDPSPSRTFSIIVIWLAGGMLTAMSLGILDNILLEPHEGTVEQRRTGCGPALPAQKAKEDRLGTARRDQDPASGQTRRTIAHRWGRTTLTTGRGGAWKVNSPYSL